MFIQKTLIVTFKKSHRFKLTDKSLISSLLYLTVSTSVENDGVKILIWDAHTDCGIFSPRYSIVAVA